MLRTKLYSIPNLVGYLVVSGGGSVLGFKGHGLGRPHIGAGYFIAHLPCTSCCGG